MLPNDFVTIRLDVEAMKASMVHAWQTRSGEIAQAIERHTDSLLKTLDWDRVVGEIAEQVLRDVVRKSLERAMQGIQYDVALREQLVAALLVKLGHPQETQG